MKRFRWGDVAPACGDECDGHETGPPGAVGLHELAVHGLVHVDPEDVGPVHPLLIPAD